MESSGKTLYGPVLKTTLPRYSVIAADTLHDPVTLTFDLLTLSSRSLKTVSSKVVEHSIAF